jgi:hypothetical protein
VPAGAYTPVYFVHREKVTAHDRLLCAFRASVLSGVQGATQFARIVNGKNFKQSRVELATLSGALGNTLGQLKDSRRGRESPSTRPEQALCGVQAPAPVSCRGRREGRLEPSPRPLPKEIAEQNRKGIFTTTQLSYTFRPGRMKRIVEAGGRRRDPALQALALREGTIYVTQRQSILDAKVEIYLDVEGLIDPTFIYLIGLLIVDGDSCRRLSFWGDRPADEAAIWASFLIV